MSVERIVVGIDGSADASAALAWAVDLARATGAEVVAVHALGLLERAATGTPEPTQPRRDEIRERFETTWCAPLAAPGVRSRRLLRDGNPVSVLLAVAEEEGADLVVVGSRGVGHHPERLLGSTSSQVTQLAGRPVAVIPPEAPAPT